LAHLKLLADALGPLPGGALKRPETRSGRHSYSYYLSLFSCDSSLTWLNERRPMSSAGTVNRRSRIAKDVQVGISGGIS
jgi:hypothetical protein